MIARIANYYRNTKWVKWIEIVSFPILGSWLIICGYTFLQDDLGNNKGLFYMTAGAFWIICTGLELLSRYLSVIGRMVTNIIETLLLVAIAVLIIIA